MKILVTGYKGFIGQHLVEDFREHELSFFEWDEALPNVKGLDWVIHLGAISSTTESDVEKVLFQNLDFSGWLINQCNNNGVNFQYSSSASVYGLNKEFSEDSPVSPKSPYAWSKYLFERYVATRNWKIIVQGFRYFNVYGKYEAHKGSQASPQFTFTKQALQDGVIKLFEGSDKYYRDFIHVNNVVDTHRAFLKIKESGIWNVGTGKAVSFEEVAREIADRYSARIEYVPMPENVKQHYQTYTCADTTKLKNSLKRA